MRLSLSVLMLMMTISLALALNSARFHSLEELSEERGVLGVPIGIWTEQSLSSWSSLRGEAVLEVATARGESTLLNLFSTEMLKAEVEYPHFIGVTSEGTVVISPDVDSLLITYMSWKGNKFTQRLSDEENLYFLTRFAPPIVRPITLIIPTIKRSKKDAFSSSLSVWMSTRAISGEPANFRELLQLTTRYKLSLISPKLYRLRGYMLLFITFRDALHVIGFQLNRDKLLLFQANLSSERVTIIQEFKPTDIDELQVVEVHVSDDTAIMYLSQARRSTSTLIKCLIHPDEESSGCEEVADYESYLLSVIPLRSNEGLLTFKGNTISLITGSGLGRSWVLSPDDVAELKAAVENDEAQYLIPTPLNTTIRQLGDRLIIVKSYGVLELLELPSSIP